jgi:mannan endo-1,4-beta-mannosidase
MRHAKRRSGDMNRTQKILSLFLVVVVLGAAAVSLALTLTHSSARQSPSTTPDCLTHGTFCTGVALKRVTSQDIAEFTHSTGVFPSIVEYYQAFGKGFSSVNAGHVAYVGARPLIQIDPHRISMNAISGGQYDTYLKSYATALKAFGHPVLLSFGHEMNGSWSSWSEPYTKPSDFIAAWRHIHNVFAKEKVKNVQWTWDVSHQYGKNGPKPWWPGSKYVDWIGIDGYLRPGQSFAHQFWGMINLVRKIATKPVFIAETGVAPGPEQTAQIKELFDGAIARHLRALIWFDVNRKEAWRLEANTEAAAAFKASATAAVNAAAPTPATASREER